ncbi:NADH-quinone oxidoreductase subunit L [Flocculibacter collagenilyticus]|uniref:NADH-quinone oxidoreductase subunit L n=1 Tax=Flocculibacter collagenilyticus TaxID=2744479 RepID=UPI0018F349C9|nr:NADH-quinone oxidoreductase subunit L [Flocculibacter collagenilyticus]
MLTNGIDNTVLENTWLNWIYLVPLMPLLGALILTLMGRYLTKPIISLVGVGSVGTAALITLLIGLEFTASFSSNFTLNLGGWIPLENTSIDFALYLDAFSMLMTSIVTGVGFVIHWYAAAYMYNDKSLSRFFVYMNLFVFAMLILVLSNNLVLLYLGWEGVGICSFLLIGFWYQKPANAKAATKAFVVTRIGDTALLIGLLLLFKEVQTLNINDIIQLADQRWQTGDTTLGWICALILFGAAGKSAQLPLQTWLPDAMAGPTPVSALIHAATMVTAGVYLIARMHPLYELSPFAMMLVSWVGVLTLLIAGLAAIAQSDIKRILAYSTVSQIGYMFVGLGAGGWASSAFHLMTHAFFKALLFLVAGSIILALHHEQNIHKMGGLVKRLPLTSTLLFVGLIALTAVPGTSGFFSKEAILDVVWHAETAGPTIWWLAVIGAMLTGIYSFRLFFIVGFGQPYVDESQPKRPLTLKEKMAKKHGNEHDEASNEQEQPEDFSVLSHFQLPLFPLAALAVFGGLIPLNLASTFGLPEAATSPSWLHITAIAFSLVGIVIAYVMYFPRKKSNASGVTEHKPFVVNANVKSFFTNGLGFDWLYSYLFVKPFHFLSSKNKNDIVDQIYTFNAWFAITWHELLVLTQSGRMRWYIASMAGGFALLLGVVLWIL